MDITTYLGLITHQKSHIFQCFVWEMQPEEISLVQNSRIKHKINFELKGIFVSFLFFKVQFISQLSDCTRDEICNICKFWPARTSIKRGMSVTGFCCGFVQMYWSNRWGTIWLAMVQWHGFGRVCHVSGYDSRSCQVQVPERLSICFTWLRLTYSSSLRGLSLPDFKLFGRARLIDGCPFLEKCRHGPRHFWDCWACLDPPLKSATLVRLVGHATNTVAVLCNCTQSSRWDTLRLTVAQRHGFSQVCHVSGYGNQSKLPSVGAGEA